MSPTLRANPVLRRELLERWRGRRAFVVVTVYLAVLSGLLYALYRMGLAILSNQFGFGVDPAFAGPSLGRFLLESLLFVVLLLVLFVTPAYAAASIAGERERRTLMLLQLTLLRPVQIVLGKLGASVAWVTLLVVAAIPLGAVLLFLGGVTLPDLLRSVVYLLVVATGVAGIALGLSSVARRTTGAAVTLYLNPFYGLADAATTTSGLGANMNLPAPLSGIAFFLPDTDRFMGFPPGPVAEDEGGRSRTPVWLITGGGYLLAGMLGVLVATNRVRSVRSRRRGRGGLETDDGGLVLTAPPPVAGSDLPPPPPGVAPPATADLVTRPPGTSGPPSTVGHDRPPVTGPGTPPPARPPGPPPGGPPPPPGARS